MSETLERVRKLVVNDEIRVSVHGFRELAADDILLDDVISGVATAAVVEEYLEFAKGPSVLVFHRDRAESPLHVLWGIPRDQDGPATVITAYRPDPRRWSANFMRRRP